MSDDKRMQMSVNVHHAKLKSVKELEQHGDTVVATFNNGDYESVTFFLTLEQVEQIGIQMFTDAARIRLEREASVSN